MTFQEATDSYEAWLRTVLLLPPVKKDLDKKRKQLAEPFPFFRGTYYRWFQHWMNAGSGLTDAPQVLAVGDLHLENFGTWRDLDGRLCWGVNDFDEADELPYTIDLVRLAASVKFAKKKSGNFDIKLGDACEAILAGYRKCLDRPDGEPFVLEENHLQLRALANNADREPVTFWADMQDKLVGPITDLPAEVRDILNTTLPTTGLAVTYYARRAGVGSLGRPRYVALADWRRSKICREAKAAAPPASAWATGATTPCRAGEAAARALRAPDPYYRLTGGWVVRRLGPRSSRIELDDLESADFPHLLRSMGAETANVHLGTAEARDAIRADLHGRPAGWLTEAARMLAERIEEDWRTANPGIANNEGRPTNS